MFNDIELDPSTPHQANHPDQSSMTHKFYYTKLKCLLNRQENN